MDYFLSIGLVKWQNIVDVCFHFFSSDQHEIKYKDHDEQVDGETADTLHYDLSDTGKYGDNECQCIFS